MRIQFLIECCCCLSSNSFNPSSPFDISKTFSCRLFIIFPFSFLSASCWPKYLVINSTALFKSLSCNSTLICELRVFSYISNNLLRSFIRSFFFEGRKKFLISISQTKNPKNNTVTQFL